MILKLKQFLKSCADNKKKKISLFALLLGGIFFLLFYLNIKTPTLGDDLSYSFIYNTTERIGGIGDIITSQINHYYLWGGRSVVHFIAQLLLLLPPLLMDAINALAFCIFLFLIYKHINPDKGSSPSLFVCIFLLVWFLMPFAETILWITGSANYMWGTMLILSFLLIYRLYNNSQQRNLFFSIMQACIMLTCGVICGWTNENIAAAMLLIAALSIASYRKNGWKIPIWAYAGIVGALIGYFVMIFAPGNAIRAEGTKTDAFLLGYRFFRHTQSLLNQLGMLNVVYIILVFIFLKESPDKKNRKILMTSLAYMAGALVGVYVMILSPSFPARAWFGVITLNIIALGILIINIKIPFIRNAKYGFIMLGILAFMLNLFDVYKDTNNISSIYSKRIELIVQAKNDGKDVIVIEPYRNRTKYTIEDPLYSEPSMSKYYDIEVKYKIDE